MVNKNHYDWGGRLKRSAMKAAGIDAKTRSWAAGMTRFDTSTPNGGKSSAYLTFRIMMEGSSGWIVPPQPGMEIAKKTAEAMQPKALSAFEEAIKRTLAT
ncbi:hypothetical protein D3C75_1182270 [compost metagenome]